MESDACAANANTPGTPPNSAADIAGRLLDRPNTAPPRNPSDFSSAHCSVVFLSPNASTTDFLIALSVPSPKSA